MITRFGVFLALLLVFASTGMAAGSGVYHTEENVSHASHAILAEADQEAFISIFLSEVSTPEPAWLKVYDSEDGKLIEPLGATYVGEGVHENVPIFMKVPEDGTVNELAVVMHSDKGELGVLDEFDLPMENVDPTHIKLHDSLSVVKHFLHTEDEEAESFPVSSDKDIFPYHVF